MVASTDGGGGANLDRAWGLATAVVLNHFYGSIFWNGQLLWFSKATIQYGSSRSLLGFMLFPHLQQ